MKKTLFFVANLLIISTLSFAQDLPTADAILDKYINAIGGKDAISKIQDLSVNSNMEMGQFTMEIESKYKFPNKMKQTVYVMGNEGRTTISDGQKYYMHSPANQFRNMPEQTENKELKEAAQDFLSTMYLAEMLYKDFGVTSTVVGIEQVAGKDAVKVEFALPDGKKWTDFFDKESGLKVKRTSKRKGMQGNEVEISALYSNYKDVNGVKFPNTITSSGFGGRGDQKLEIQSIKANKGLKDKEFEIK